MDFLMIESHLEQNRSGIDQMRNDCHQKNCCCNERHLHALQADFPSADLMQRLFANSQHFADRAVGTGTMMMLFMRHKTGIQKQDEQQQEDKDSCRSCFFLCVQKM